MNQDVDSCTGAVEQNHQGETRKPLNRFVLRFRTRQVRIHANTRFYVVRTALPIHVDQNERDPSYMKSGVCANEPLRWGIELFRGERQHLHALTCFQFLQADLHAVLELNGVSICCGIC